MELFVEFVGCSLSIEMIWEQFEDLIQDLLIGFIYVFDDMLVCYNVSWVDFVVVVIVGGGVNIFFVI